MQQARSHLKDHLTPLLHFTDKVMDSETLIGLLNVTQQAASKARTRIHVPCVLVSHFSSLPEELCHKSSKEFSVSLKTLAWEHAGVYWEEGLDQSDRWRRHPAKTKALEKPQDPPEKAEEALRPSFWLKPQRMLWAQCWCLCSFKYIHNVNLSSSLTSHSPHYQPQFQLELPSQYIACFFQIIVTSPRIPFCIHLQLSNPIRLSSVPSFIESFFSFPIMCFLT